MAWTATYRFFGLTRTTVQCAHCVDQAIKRTVGVPALLYRLLVSDIQSDPLEFTMADLCRLTVMSGDHASCVCSVAQGLDDGTAYSAISTNNQYIHCLTGALYRRR